MITPMKKPNAAIAKMVTKVTGGKRVSRGMKAPMNKGGVKPNIPVMADDRTGPGVNGGPSYSQLRDKKYMAAMAAKAKK